MDKVHNILSEICIGGMVLETNMSEILVHVDAQSKLEKSESSPTSTIKVVQGLIVYHRVLHTQPIMCGPGVNCLS